ncbi:MAG TPA: nitrilase-related carbon-nitrogen hydrolase [Myxococcaceae bacterium]|nr:nitrilase-related carbon-nitrogen hydrolase [Myxococcaceae bacterium]
MSQVERSPRSHPSAQPALLLVLGATLTAAAHMRWGVGLLAWAAPIPFLRYLRITRGFRSRLLFAVAEAVAWTLATAKIVTAPLPLAFAAVGVVVALFHVAGTLTWDGVRRLAPRWATLAFPAAMVLAEWVQHRFTFMTSWGAAAYTQVDDLPLLQVASLGGMAAVSFAVYWLAAAVESLLSARLDGQPTRAAARGALLAAAAVVVAHVFGAVRLAMPLPGEPVTVAAVGTTASFGPDSLPTADERARTAEALRSDTERAAAAGARLVVWTEAAALVPPDEEAAFIERAGALARAGRIHLVVAYIVPKGPLPAPFENKYRWFGPDGTLLQTYFKHHPAPGEPAMVGREPLTAVETGFARAGGALCYDYDVPRLAAEHGLLGVDLVALPSSDWRGIDPIHTQMAGLRAIEQGVSILRSTRMGLSAGIDPHGRMRAWRSSFEGGDRVLLVTLPARGVHTLYRATGDLLVGASALFLLIAAGVPLLRRVRVRRA